MSEIKRYYSRYTKQQVSEAHCAMVKVTDHAAALAEKDAEIAHWKKVAELMAAEIQSRFFSKAPSVEEIIKIFSEKAGE